MYKAPFMTEDHEMFQKSLRKFLEKEAVPNFISWEKSGIIPRSFWEKLGNQGYLCPWLPEEYGGSGVDFAYSVIIHQELERIGTGLVGVGLHNDVVTKYIWHFGTEEQKKKWLPKCASGEIISAIAMTEPGTGSDLSAIRTTAKKQGDHYIVNGAKTFITNGIHGDLIIVVCRTGTEETAPHKGISLIVADKDTVGFQRGKKLEKVGMHSSDTAELFFEDAKIPAENLLGEVNKGFYYLMQQLPQERLMVGIQAIANCEKMIELTVSYVKERKVFGKPVSSYQNTQMKLAEFQTETEIGRTFVDQVTQRHMNGENVTKEVAMLKWWTTDLAKKIASECVQLHGGYGYMEDYEIARRYRDSPVAAIYAGTNEIMKLIIAKEMDLS